MTCTIFTKLSSMVCLDLLLDFAERRRLNLGNRFQTLEGNKVSWAVEVIGAGALRWPYLNYYSYGPNFTCMDDTLCNTGALDDFDTRSKP